MSRYPKGYTGPMTTGGNPRPVRGAPVKEGINKPASMAPSGGRPLPEAIDYPRPNMPKTPTRGTGPNDAGPSRGGGRAVSSAIARSMLSRRPK